MVLYRFFFINNLCIYLNVIGLMGKGGVFEFEDEYYGNGVYGLEVRDRKLYIINLVKGLG